MPTTSETLLRETLVPMWDGVAMVERRVSEAVLLDEVLPSLDLDDPSEELRPAALVLQAIEDELRPGGVRAWPDGELNPKRRREMAIIVFLDLVARELGRLATRLKARAVVLTVLQSVESARVAALLSGPVGIRRRAQPRPALVGE